MITTILATIPQPPVDAVMPKTAETIFNVFIFIPLGIGLALELMEQVELGSGGQGGEGASGEMQAGAVDGGDYGFWG